jgi:putative transposase
MSWKTTNAQKEKEHFILEYGSGDYGVAEMARRYGISRKTAYKWAGRYESEGLSGLEERGRAPRHHPNELSAEIVAKILELKARWPSFGAPKLHWKLQRLMGAERCPAESSIGRVLQSHGLTRPCGRRRWRAEGSGKTEYTGVNDVWCADFKGWFMTEDGRKCTPLTISDGRSRYLLRCQGLNGGTGSAIVQPLFEATMREYGVPLAIHTDNGAPFASTGIGGLTELSIWLLRVGVRLDRSRPGCPQDNGRHERMHRTLKAATAQPPAANLRAQQKAFDDFRQEYNEERPHEGLGGQTPAEVYTASPRDFPERLARHPEYPSEWETRAVRACGKFSWKGENIMLTKPLVGQRVGLEPLEDGVWRVYFARHELGIFEERKGRVRPPKKTAPQPLPVPCPEATAL